MADAADLKSALREGVPVRVRPVVPIFTIMKKQLAQDIAESQNQDYWKGFEDGQKASKKEIKELKKEIKSLEKKIDYITDPSSPTHGW